MLHDLLGPELLMDLAAHAALIYLPKSALNRQGR